MLVLKFSFASVVAVMVVIYMHWPGEPVVLDPEVATNMTVATFALLAAVLFLISLMPSDRPDSFPDRVISRFLQLMGTGATLITAIQLVGKWEDALQCHQLVAVWAILLTGLLAGIISFVGVLVAARGGPIPSTAGQGCPPGTGL